MTMTRARKYKQMLRSFNDIYRAYKYCRSMFYVSCIYILQKHLKFVKIKKKKIIKNFILNMFQFVVLFVKLTFLVLTLPSLKISLKMELWPEYMQNELWTDKTASIIYLLLNFIIIEIKTLILTWNFNIILWDFNWIWSIFFSCGFVYVRIDYELFSQLIWNSVQWSKIVNMTIKQLQNKKVDILHTMSRTTDCLLGLIIFTKNMINHRTIQTILNGTQFT